MGTPPAPDKVQMEVFEWLVAGYRELYQIEPTNHTVGRYALFEHSPWEWLSFNHVWNWEDAQWYVVIDHSGLEVRFGHSEWHEPL